MFIRKKNLNFVFITKDIDNRRSQLMQQHLREKSDERVPSRTDQVKTRHTELDTKNHEDQLKYLEVKDTC